MCSFELFLFTLTTHPVKSVDRVEIRTDRDMQHFSMRLLIGWTPDVADFTDFLKSMRLSGRNTLPEDECTYFGVTCMKGHISNIQWAHMWSFFRGNIFWLPKSIKGIHTTTVRFQQHFSLRKLPPKLQHFTVIHGGLEGSLDFDYLPAKIVVFSVINNNFSGTVFIRNIRPTVQNIDLRYNTISKIIALPKSIRKCSFFYEVQLSGKKCKFQQL